MLVTFQTQVTARISESTRVENASSPTSKLTKWMLSSLCLVFWLCHCPNCDIAVLMLANRVHFVVVFVINHQGEIFFNGSLRFWQIAMQGYGEFCCAVHQHTIIHIYLLFYVHDI